MRRIEPKRELKHYESEGSAIRRIMNEKLVTHHDRGVDTPHYQATMKKQGKVKLRKSGDYDDHGTHTVYASPEDVQKYMAKGYKKVPMDEDNYQATMKGHMKDRDKKDKAAGMVKLRKDDDGIHTVTVKQADVQAYIAKGYKRIPIGEEVGESINIIEEKIPSKLMTLLRMGLVEKGELETMKRALKSGEDAMTQPVLRQQIYELFNKLVEAITDDQQIWVRMRKRLQTDNKEEE